MSLIANRFLNDIFSHEPFGLFKSDFKPFEKMDFTTGLNYDAYRENNQLVLVFNMPGHSGMDDIKAAVDKEKRTLNVESNEVDEKKVEDQGRVYYHKGESNKRFFLQLPEDIDLSSAKAVCENGQLKVSFAIFDPKELEDESTISLRIEKANEIV